MTLKELSIFYHLCEMPHLSQLGEKLNLSQSAISLAIKSLEKKLGQQLFDRIGKKLILNEVGHAFYEATYAHFMALNEAQNLLKEERLYGTLNIASSKTIGDYITPHIVFDFLSKHPHVKIHKEIYNSSTIISMVQQGEIDVGFIESACDEDDIIKEVIGHDELIIVSADKTLRGNVYYIDELFHKQWILREKGSGTRSVFLEALGSIAHDVTVLMEFSEFEEAKTLLLKHPQTITCLSRIVVEAELARAELFEVALRHFKLQRPFYLIYHKNKYLSSFLKAFLQFVREHPYLRA